MDEDRAGEAVQGTADVESLRAEVERLRAENEELAASGAVTTEQRSARTRTRWALALVVVAAVFATLAVPAVWLNRIVFDTEAWVATVAPLAQDPDIQDAVATSASDAIIEQLDAQARIEKLLPDELDLLAPMIAGGVEGLVRDGATELVRSDQFAQLWEEANRLGHKTLVAAVTGRQGVVGVEGGTATLDIGLFAEQLKASLVAKGVGIAEAIPADRLDKTFTLFRSPALASLGPVFDGISQAAYVIPLLALGLAASGLALAGDRRRAALWLGAGIVIAGLLPMQAVYLGEYYAIGQLQALQSAGTAAAASAYTIIFRDLIAAERVLIFFGVVVWVSALLAGPSKWAVALRQGLSGGMSGAASQLDLGGFGAWVSAHKPAMRTVGYVGAVLLLLWMPAPRSMGDVVLVAVLAVVWLLAVEFLGAGGSATQAPAADGDPEEAS